MSKDASESLDPLPEFMPFPAPYPGNPIKEIITRHVQVWVHPSATLNDVLDKAIPAVCLPFPILPGMKRVKITLIAEYDPIQS
jgi:hypothetical protein